LFVRMACVYLPLSHGQRNSRDSIRPRLVAGPWQAPLLRRGTSFGTILKLGVLPGRALKRALVALEVDFWASAPLAPHAPLLVHKGLSSGRDLTCLPESAPFPRSGSILSPVVGARAEFWRTLRASGRPALWRGRVIQIGERGSRQLLGAVRADGIRIECVAGFVESFAAHAAHQ
jgi:hypothetical protein